MPLPTDLMALELRLSGKESVFHPWFLYDFLLAQPCWGLMHMPVPSQSEPYSTYKGALPPFPVTKVKNFQAVWDS